jgi:DNA-binding CsgD family transcriptional regulator
VRRIAKRLFPAEVKSGPWTASEAQELKRYLGATTPEVIARILGRSVEEVQAQILDLGRIQRSGSWARAEIARFKRIFGTRTDEDLSRIFGQSTDEVRRLAREHGLSKDKAFLRKLHGAPATRMPRWKDEELEILRSSYAAQPNLEIARRLGRSAKSVLSKAHLLGLKKSDERMREMGRENVRVRYSAS